MLNEPFFQTDILNHIIKYMSFYLSYENWFLTFICFLFFIYCCYKVATYQSTVSYKGAFPQERYVFSLQRKSDVYAFVFLILCFAYNVLGIFSQDLSLFANYDTRGNVIPIFERGVFPAWGSFFRFCPIAYWDTNIIYALTHHFGIIGVYLSFQSLIIIWLLNCFLRFIPAAKRLICIGLIMISPAVFSIGNIIFSERMLLIYILGSFICMQKYAENPKKTYFLWLTILLINFALYTKELSVLLYCGILGYYAVGHLLEGKITPSSFFHPIKTVRAFPFEVLLFLSLLIYAGLYGAHMPPTRYSKYVSDRALTLYTSFKLYYTEIIIAAISFYFMLRNLFSKKKYTFIEGMTLGATLTAFALAFVLRIGHLVPSMENKSYYMIIPFFIGMICIFWYIKNKYVLAFVCCALFVNALVRDYVIYNNDDGHSYREVAEAIMSKNKNPTVYIFMANHLDYDAGWFIRSWVTPYKYYWPNRIKFFSAEINLRDIFLYNKESIYYKEKPDEGDYFVVRKDKYHSEALKQISENKSAKIFENDRFEVYIIK